MEWMLVALLLIISMKGLHDGGLANLGLMLARNLRHTGWEFLSVPSIPVPIQMLYSSVHFIFPYP